MRIESQQPLLRGLGRIEAQQARHHQLQQVNPLRVLQIDPPAAPPPRHLSGTDPQQLSKAPLRPKVVAEGGDLLGRGYRHASSLAQRFSLRGLSLGRDIYCSHASRFRLPVDESMMDFNREEHRWYALIGAALAISGILLLIRYTSDGNDRTSPGSRALTVRPQPAAARHAPPSGAWEATGIVVYVPPSVDSTQPEGTVVKRPWKFTRVCRGECKVIFTRGTLYGPSTTTLVARGKRFIANFPPVEVPCAYHRSYSGPRHLSGESHDAYVLWWEGNSQLRAVEHRTETGCNPTTDPPDVTRWRSKPAVAANRL